MPATDRISAKQKEELHTFKLQDLFDKRYASKEEVRIIRVIVFGAVGLILTGVLLTALVTLAHLNPNV